MDLNIFLLSFVAIFVAVDALGMVPIYLGLTASIDEAKKKSLVKNSIWTALLVALLFLAVGEFAFRWIGITMGDFMIAGGAVLFLISIRDLLTFEKVPPISNAHLGVVPLAVPLMVGPGVLTTSLICLRSYGLVPTLVSIILNILLCGLILSRSGYVSKLLGEAGSLTLSKISNLFLGAIGVMLIRRGILEIITQFSTLQK